MNLDCFKCVLLILFWPAHEKHIVCSNFGAPLSIYWDSIYLTEQYPVHTAVLKWQSLCMIVWLHFPSEDVPAGHKIRWIQSHREISTLNQNDKIIFSLGIVFQRGPRGVAVHPQNTDLSALAQGPQTVSFKGCQSDGRPGICQLHLARTGSSLFLCITGLIAQYRNIQHTIPWGTNWLICVLI